jgi:hypothetical protein
MRLSMTFSKGNIEHKTFNDWAESHYAECRGTILALKVVKTFLLSISKFITKNHQ